MLGDFCVLLAVVGAGGDIARDGNGIQRAAGILLQQGECLIVLVAVIAAHHIVDVDIADGTKRKEVNYELCAGLRKK